VFDIDGTILDARYLVPHALLAYDREQPPATSTGSAPRTSRPTCGSSWPPASAGRSATSRGICGPPLDTLRFWGMNRLSLDWWTPAIRELIERLEERSWEGPLSCSVEARREDLDHTP
jgi:hypothetical protein